MKHIADFKKHFALLLEAGFVAVNQADEDAALKLFKAASLLDPTSTLPEVGVGYLHLHKLEVKQACKAFENVLKKDPKNDMARAFLGLAMTFTADRVEEGEKILKETHKASGDPQIRTLTESSLKFVEKFVKKSGNKGKSLPGK
jgi:tetratricopeptide (TPR) repeat protein